MEVHRAARQRSRPAGSIPPLTRTQTRTLTPSLSLTLSLTLPYPSPSLTLTLTLTLILTVAGRAALASAAGSRLLHPFHFHSPPARGACGRGLRDLRGRDRAPQRSRARAAGVTDGDGP